MTALEIIRVAKFSQVCWVFQTQGVTKTKPIFTEYMIYHDLCGCRCIKCPRELPPNDIDGLMQKRRKCPRELPPNDIDGLMQKRWNSSTSSLRLTFFNSTKTTAHLSYCQYHIYIYSSLWLGDARIKGISNNGTHFYFHLRIQSSK